MAESYLYDVLNINHFWLAAQENFSYRKPITLSLSNLV